MVDATDNGLDPVAAARVARLIDRFRAIDPTMADLPLYNGKLTVEGYGFQRDGDQIVGVLITPWFMNIVVLPVAAEAIDPNGYGKSKMITLAGGAFPCLYNGDPAVGAFWGHSLHSPMDVFVSMDQARAEAKLRLAHALTAPEPPKAPVVAERSGETLANSGRRTLFTGLLRA